MFHPDHSVATPALAVGRIQLNQMSQFDCPCPRRLATPNRVASTIIIVFISAFYQDVDLTGCRRNGLGGLCA